ncbi:Eukaryotic translation initiation factor 5A-1 [Balamuthia mandrillaris]
MAKKKVNHNNNSDQNNSNNDQESTHSTSNVNVVDNESLSYPDKMNNVKKGGFILINGHPCKVVEINKSKPGKHGHAKAHIVGIDLFTGKKREMLSSGDVEVPRVDKDEFLLVDVKEDGAISLLTASGALRSDLDLPKGELGETIRERFEEEGAESSIYLTVLRSMGKEQVISMRTQKE